MPHEPTLKGNKLAESFFFIETQWDNLGDALINRALIDLIGKHANLTLGTVFAPNAFKEMIGHDFLEKYTLDSKSNREIFLFKILLERIRGNACYLFLSPGGWIGELDGCLNLRSWSHALLYHILAIAGVKICQVGVSYEDIGPKLGWLLRFRSPAMYKHFVRDELSMKTMRKKGVRIDGICPDLAFSEFESIVNKVTAKGITFSFRGDQYPDQIDEIKNTIGFVLEVLPPEYPVYFVSQVKKDRPVNQEIAKWAENTYGIKSVINDGTKEIKETKSLYSRSGIVISNRLHSLLLAGSVGNKMIAAPIGENNKKIRSLFDDIGIGRNVFSAPETLKESLSEFFPSTLDLFNAQKQKDSINEFFDSVFREQK